MLTTPAAAPGLEPHVVDVNLDEEILKGPVSEVDEAARNQRRGGRPKSERLGNPGSASAVRQVMQCQEGEAEVHESLRVDHDEGGDPWAVDFHGERFEKDASHPPASGEVTAGFLADPRARVYDDRAPDGDARTDDERVHSKKGIHFGIECSASG